VLRLQELLFLLRKWVLSQAAWRCVAGGMYVPASGAGRTRSGGERGCVCARLQVRASVQIIYDSIWSGFYVGREVVILASWSIWAPSPLPGKDFQHTLCKAIMDNNKPHMWALDIICRLSTYRQCDQALFQSTLGATNWDTKIMNILFMHNKAQAKYVSFSV